MRSFGGDDNGFRLDVDRRLLLKGDQPVEVGSRAIDLLICLVRHGGNVVSKDQLLAAAWPETFVEESNLRVHIGVLFESIMRSTGPQSCFYTASGMKSGCRHQGCEELLEHALIKV